MWTYLTDGYSNRLFIPKCSNTQWGFPDDSVVKNLPAIVGDSGLIPGLGRSPGEGNESPLQYSCLRNPMDREEPGELQSMGLQKSRT